MVNQSDRTGEKPAGSFSRRCLPVEHEFIGRTYLVAADGRTARPLLSLSGPSRLAAVSGFL